VLGWLALEPGDRRRRPWQAFGVVVALALLAFAPAQAGRLGDLRHALERQASIQADLRRLVADDRVPCAITVPNRRPIPLLALWLDRRPQQIATAQEGAPARGAYLAPASAQVASDYILDRRDRDRRVAPPPAGFEQTAANASWRLLTRGCP
jgi:hypothetical protein